MSVCAVICGAEGWDEIDDFGHAKLDFLRQDGDFEAGELSHDTLARVMALVNAEQLQTVFAEWMKACHDVAEGCQKKIAAKVLQKGANYLLSVKDNQPALAGAFEAAFLMGKVVSFEVIAFPD